MRSKVQPMERQALISASAVWWASGVWGSGAKRRNTEMLKWIRGRGGVALTGVGAENGPNEAVMGF